MKTRTLIAACALLVSTLDVLGQVSLPPVQTPSLPRVDPPIGVDETLSNTTRALDPNNLRDLRLLRVRDLIRRNRDVIEADPQGAPVLRGEVLVFSPSTAAIERALGAGYIVLRERSLEGLDARLVVLRAPAGTSTRRALKQLRALDPGGTYDLNHIYTESGAVTPASSPPSVVSSPQGTDPTQAIVRVGLIDGGVDGDHAVFRGLGLQLHGCDAKRVPSAHGTAVASLLVGRTGEFLGAAAGATLYAADVYCGVAVGGAVDAVVEALAWMARERVPVINVSLVGPPNRMLETVIKALLARGHILVAAVGNDGPAAPPLYPAAYESVVGVTGVDARQRVLLEAARGPQVDFAAPGADMAAASTESPFATVRGTSFAAPIVAGLLAGRLAAPDAQAASRAIGDLKAHAVDLGPRGRDKTFGDGLVGNALRASPGLASAPAR